MESDRNALVVKRVGLCRQAFRFPFAFARMPFQQLAGIPSPLSLLPTYPQCVPTLSFIDFNLFCIDIRSFCIVFLIQQQEPDEREKRTVTLTKQE